jgi:hypothetical protein
MNTNTIKSFARQARTLLLAGVTQRLRYWGFDANGANDLTLEPTTGGYVFRGQVFTDTSVPATWQKLKKRLTSKQAVQDVVEEAAYVWFNRLMAIKILEEKGYLPPTLRYTTGLRTPLLVQNAKRGQHGITRLPYLDLLNEYLREDKEEEAFGLLLTRLCHSHSLLQDVFGRIDDYTELLLPQNLLQSGGLLDLMNSDTIAADDYREVELIGWLYQFYISDKKDQVFAGFKQGRKARAEDIPAATQIFTPKWIVKYMVENTVGKLYLDYEPHSALKAGMKYLVENDADGTHPPLLTDLTELTLLDPAAGSGHILVTGFELLFSMYREAGYTARSAVESILKHNLYGLDIDDRARQLARFAVLLKAASYDPTILDKGIQPHIYSFPEPATFRQEDIQAFLGTDGSTYLPELTDALRLLSQGKNIGSALKVELSADARRLVEQQYQLWQQKQRTASQSILETSLWNSLCPYLEVLLVLSRQYAAVVANPPYMGQKSMNEALKDYVNSKYPLSKADLFAVFMEVCLSLTGAKGLMGMINQHSWMFLSSYEKLRGELLGQYGIASMLHLGPRTFEELSGEVVQSTTFVFEKGKEIQTGTYYRLVDYRSNNEKEAHFLQGDNRYPNISQTNFSKIPGSPIAYWVSERISILFSRLDNLEKIIETREGLATANNNLFLRNWSEVNPRNILKNCTSNDYASISKKRWFPYVKGGSFRRWWGNNSLVVDWEKNGERVKKNIDPETGRVRSHNYNGEYAFREGVSWSGLTNGEFALRYVPKGFMFDAKGPMGFLRSNQEDVILFKVLGLLNGKITAEILSILAPTLDFKLGHILNIPFSDNEYELENIKSFVTKCIALSQVDWDSRETSWDFQQSPLLNGAPSLKQAYQRWEAAATQDFFQLHANEEELNRIFIDIYALQEELTPEVPLKDITILQEELDCNSLELDEAGLRQQGTGIRAKDEGLPLVPEGYRLPIKKAEVMSQFVSYAIGVLLGRYRLGTPGLHIAHPNATEEELAGYTYQGHQLTIDEDAILPLLGDDGAFPDDALLRTRDLMVAIWGEDTLTENLNFLHEGLGMNLHKWLTGKFWDYHTNMYKNKPIYWLFCSNPKKPQQSAFRVLVYMHRMDKYTVGKIQRQYLHPHQEYIRHEIQRLADQENSLGKSELKRLETLRNHALECRDYNEVLKELSLREIEFDLDDGVDVNYAKFEGAVAKI